MMNIELLDGENEIRMNSDTEATDGIYVSLARYAEENDISEATIRVWRRRKKLETVSIFGKVYVKKDSLPATRRYKKTRKSNQRVSIQGVN